MADNNSYYGFEEILNSFENDEDIIENKKDIIANKTTNNVDINRPKIDEDLLYNQKSNETMNNKTNKISGVYSDNENQKDKTIKFYLGHRQRAKERFLSSPQTISDYDLFELILFLIVPRADVKQIAKVLIDKYKTYNNIFSANEEELSSVGINGKSIKYLSILFKEFYKRYFKQFLINSSLNIDNFSTLIEYLHSSFVGLQEEEFHVLFLNNQLKLIDERSFGMQQVTNVTLDVRGIIKTSLDLHAKNVILSHNHPSGDLQPSIDDINTTDELVFMFSNLDIEVLDHIIITNNSYFSFKENGLLQKNNKT